jgi:hypothetical protein
VVPPFVGVAVKITDLPEQIAPDGTAAILTLAGRLVFTVMVIPEEVAGLPETHVRDEAIFTDIISPVANDALVYVTLFVPTGEVPLYH